MLAIANSGHQEEFCRHLIRDFACWKMWITLRIRSACVLQWDRGKIRHQAQIKWVVSLMIVDALSKELRYYHVNIPEAFVCIIM